MSLRLFWFGVVVSLPLHCLGQSQTLRVSQWQQSQYLNDYAQWTETDLPKTLRDTASFRWQSFSVKPQPKAHRAYWLRFVLYNDTDSTETIFANTSPNNHHVQFFTQTPDNQSKKMESGTMLPTSRWASEYYDNYIPLRLAAGQTLLVNVRVANRSGVLPTFTGINAPKPSVNIRLEREAHHLRASLRDYRQNMPEYQYRSWIQGALLLVLLFVGLLYWQYRQRIFLYYGGYVLAGVVFSLLKTRAYTPLGHALGEWPLLKAHLMESVMWWGIGSYLFFIVELLDLPKNHPHIQRRFRQMAFGLTGYGLLYLVLMLLTNDGGLQQISFWGGRIVAIPIYVITLLWVVRRAQSPMVPYVLAANAVLGFFGIIAWLRAGEVILKGVKLPANVDDLLTLSFAVVMEILVLSLALAQRFRLLEKEKTESQRAYFEELEAKAANEKRMAETEMLALRSQMNPHFLFNSLNSLEYLIVAHDEAKATQYLAKFSKLLRMTLTHSREDAISLADELTALRYYLEIEATRLGEGFSYSIEVAKEIDLDSVMIPPLLLQPFVENAIWHGLMPSHQPDKRLTVRIAQKLADQLEFEIEDNGIGLQQATELRNRSTMKRKSYGMEITQRRIELFNRTYPNQLHIEVFDLQKDSRTGTLVRIGYKSYI
jgi:Histidine kinase/7TM diverse intracellular signalling/7TMR-DISM extracellular 2